MTLNVRNKELVIRDIVSSTNADIQILQQRVVVEVSKSAGRCIERSCLVVNLGSLYNTQNSLPDLIYLPEPSCVES